MTALRIWAVILAIALLGIAGINLHYYITTGNPLSLVATVISFEIGHLSLRETFEVQRFSPRIRWWKLPR